jgi:hypothetical protein
LPAVDFDLRIIFRTFRRPRSVVHAPASDKLDPRYSVPVDVLAPTKRFLSSLEDPLYFIARFLSVDGATVMSNAPVILAAHRKQELCIAKYGDVRIVGDDQHLPPLFHVAKRRDHAREDRPRAGR